MKHRKLLAGVAVVAALGAGATIGLFLGVPGLSNARTPGPPPGPPPGPAPSPGARLRGPSAGPEFGALAGIVAKDLTMTPAELKAALRGGQSIAALAKSKNVDPQKIIDDLMAGVTTRIDAAVTAGKITTAQAAKMKARLTAGITAFVNGTMKGPGAFRHRFRGRFGGPFRGPGRPGRGGRWPTSTATPATA
jgi:hypothetical protein